jgi:Bacteriophage head to tail connecting protein
MADADNTSRASKLKKLQRLRSRHEALKTERSSWLNDWRDIAEQMRPRGFRETRSEVNKSDRSKQRNIINFTPIEARRTLATGMANGITSPSRPWFRLTLPDPAVAELPSSKAWLLQVARALLQLLARSNIYKGLNTVYDDIGTFGVTAMHVEPDLEDGARAYNFPVGSFSLAASARGSIDTIFREVSLTVAQLVELFGLERCSRTVQNMHRQGSFDTRIEVVHAIYPNSDYTEGRFGQEGKRFCSDWWEEQAAQESDELFLREAGFERFPVLCPSWTRTGEDVYGTGPGFDALGDCRALQLLERRTLQGAEKLMTPPMSAPVSARNTPVSLLPGDVNFIDSLATGQALRAAVDVNPTGITVAEAKIRQHEERIRRAFYAHLWLLITEQTGQMTATEVGQRREEKLQQLGAVLDPLLDLLFDIAAQLGMIPPPPDELQGLELKPEYISIMAAAQKLLATTGLERLAAFVIELAQGNPASLDKLDWDQLIDEYADALGVSPSTVLTDEAVEAIREARQKLQAQAQEMAAAQQGADTAKTLADTKLEQPSALTAMLKGLGQR